jgi:hypothetical protein
MTHSDPETPVRYIPAAEYVARHRARATLREIVARWLSAGDWRMIVGALVCLVAAAVLAVLTM